MRPPFSLARLSSHWMTWLLLAAATLGFASFGRSAKREAARPKERVARSAHPSAQVPREFDASGARPLATRSPHSIRHRDPNVRPASAESLDADGQVIEAAVMEEVWPPRAQLTESRRREIALDRLRQARQCLQRGDLKHAWILAAEAERIDARLEELDDRPDFVREDIERIAQEARIRLAAEQRAQNLMNGEPRPESEPNPNAPSDSDAFPQDPTPRRVPFPGRTPSEPAESTGEAPHQTRIPQEAAPVRNGFLRSESPVTPLFPNSPTNAPATRLSFQFHQAPWDLVLQRFADEARLSLHMDTIPPGTLTYFDPQEYTPSEVQDLLNGFLIPRGFLLVRRDRALAVIDVSGGLPAGMIPEVAEGEIDRLGMNDVFSVSFAIPHAPAARAALDLRPFLSPLGTITPLEYSNRILVTDMGRSIRRIRDVLAFEPNDPHRCISSVHSLRNTKAVEVAKAITDFLGRTAPMAGPAGSTDQARAPLPSLDPQIMVVAEPTTNSLLVSAPPNRIAEIQGLIERLDSAPAEVLIQALLVEVELGNVDELGVELGVQDSILFDRSVVNNVLTVTESVANPVSGVVTSSQKIISQTAAPGFNFNGQPLGNNVAIHPSKVGTQGGSTLGVGRINGDLGYGGMVLSAGSESISVLIRALSEKRKVDILSRPQIRTIDNRPAEIQIGQQVPVVDGVSVTAVGSANPVIRQDKAGIILTVTPHIRNDGHVVIDVTAEKSQFNLAKGAGVPIFTDATNGNVIEAPVKDITQARTSVSCLGGQTIVLGGMITKSQVDVKRKVPYLGDIPYLGVAFRYTYDETRRRELLIFLTPHVIRDPLGDSERLKQEEVARTHYPHASAHQMHGDVLAPPQTQPGSLPGHSPDAFPTIPPDERPEEWSPGAGPANDGFDADFVPPSPAPPQAGSSRPNENRSANAPSPPPDKSPTNRAPPMNPPRTRTPSDSERPPEVARTSGTQSRPSPRATAPPSPDGTDTNPVPVVPPKKPGDRRSNKTSPWKTWRFGKAE